MNNFVVSPEFSAKYGQVVSVKVDPMYIPTENRFFGTYRMINGELMVVELAISVRPPTEDEAT
ncbi:MAG: hypothetical protein L6Q29_02510 [Candidatus Pacebacteria bacterium]|nr:hypothetical protein [Candidatus Paceibacterota bacterium]